MSHLKRQDGPGRVFHVTSRVNWRAWHLQDDSAKDDLAQLLADTAEEYGVAVLACVLLSNHMHAVLQSPPPGLFRRLTGRRTRCRHFRPWPPGHQKSTVIGQFMRVVRRATAVRRQGELGLAGRFWESAYDARPVENTTSLVIRIAYDHRNPVKAGLAKRPEDYIWSTARQWATGKGGAVPLILRNPLPFDVDPEELRAAVLHYQGVRRLDDLTEELEQLLRPGVDPDVLQQFLNENGIPEVCGTRAAKR